MPKAPSLIRKKLQEHAAKGFSGILASERNLYNIYFGARQELEIRLATYAEARQTSLTGPRFAKLLTQLQTDLFPFFEKEYKKEVGKSLTSIAEEAYRLSKIDIGETSVIGSFDKRLFELALADDYTHVAGATKKMEQATIGQLRRASAQVMREASLTGKTRHQISRELIQAMRGPDGDFAFMDAGGHIWNDKAYFDMLGRTMLHNNARDIYLGEVAKEGNDIVTISISGGNVCEACLKYEDKLLSISGTHPRYPSLEQAQRDGLFHPNCTHRIVAVPPEIAAAAWTENGDAKTEIYKGPGQRRN